MVLANLASEIYFSYVRALGKSPVAMPKMAGMAMPDKASSMNVDMDMRNAGNVGLSSNMTAAMKSNNAIIKKVNDYQTTQSLAAGALEIFNKNLSPIADPS